MDSKKANYGIINVCSEDLEDYEKLANKAEQTLEWANAYTFQGIDEISSKRLRENNLDILLKVYGILTDRMNKHKKKESVFWNHGESPIFISHSIKRDPFGGPGSMENKIIIMPGDGIDLDILNLKPFKPEKE